MQNPLEKLGTRDDWLSNLGVGSWQLNMSGAKLCSKTGRVQAAASFSPRSSTPEKCLFGAKSGLGRSVPCQVTS